MCLSNEAKPSSFSKSFVSFVVSSRNFVTFFPSHFFFALFLFLRSVELYTVYCCCCVYCSMSRYHLMCYHFVVQMITTIFVCLPICLFCAWAFIFSTLSLSPQFSLCVCVYVDLYTLYFTLFRVSFHFSPLCIFYLLPSIKLSTN